MIAFWTTYGFYLWIGSSLLIVGLLVWIGRLSKRLRATDQRYTALIKGVDAEHLEDIWLQRSLQVAHHDDQITTLEREVRRLGRSSLHHVGLVRFNPFGDVGGDQSYALALLDGEQTGVVLSSIYSRSGVRTYAKAVQRGQSTHTLSEEEVASIAQALGQFDAPESAALPATTGGNS